MKYFKGKRHHTCYFLLKDSEKITHTLTHTNVNIRGVWVKVFRNPLYYSCNCHVGLRLYFLKSMRGEDSFGLARKSLRPPAHPCLSLSRSERLSLAFA